MDSITQAILGAAVGEAVLGRKLGNRAAVAGAIIATIPDLDVILYAWYDHYEMLSIHRGYSHSLTGSLVGAFVITWLLKRFRGFQTVRSGTLWLFTWLALITHVLLDLFTGYGTQFLLPFSHRRLGLDSVNIVDPVYTLPLLIGLVLTLRLNPSAPKRHTFNRWGLLFSTGYLLLTLGVKQHVQSAFNNQLETEHIRSEDILTLPVGIGSIYWYGVARTDDQLYLQKYALMDGFITPLYAFPIQEEYLEEIDPEVAQRMRWFAKGFYTVEKEADSIRVFNLQVDMRGPVSHQGHLSPTRGYFQISNQGGKTQFSSGTISGPAPE
ncbi:MAG: metal-dependent hydrolase [Saprospiraceae bacterium]|nr:metal-dependent hydrolase [Saprospiraceae bacterium]